MPKAAWGSATDLFLIALRDHGPMTRVQLQHLTGVDKHTAGQIVSRLLRPMTRGEFAGKRRARISRWVFTSDGNERDYLRPVYAYGDGPDAKRPPPKSPQRVKHEYWIRRKNRLGRFAPGADLQRIWK